MRAKDCGCKTSKKVEAVMILDLITTLRKKHTKLIEGNQKLTCAIDTHRE